MKMNYFTLNPPTQYRAGYTGVNQTPFYFDCAKCGAKEPKIAAMLASAPADSTYVPWDKIGVIKLPNGFYNPALFCEACWQTIQTEQRLDACAPELLEVMYNQCDDCDIYAKTNDLIRKTDHHGGFKVVCRDRDACHRRSPG